MKIVRFIIAFYLLFLAVYPCSDKEMYADERMAGTAFVDNGSFDHSTAKQDVCTPFCICSCCAAHVRIASVSNIDFTGVIHNTKETIPYIEKRVLADNNHIWQPPKI